MTPKPRTVPTQLAVQRLAHLCPEARQGIRPSVGSEAGISLEQSHELLRSEDLALAEDQRREQVVFGWLQVDSLPVNHHFLLNEVDIEHAVVEGCQRVLGIHSLSLPL